MDNNLKGRKVLVTGADGFIGSHLVEKLVQAGADVSAFVFYNSFNSWGWIDTFDPNIRDALQVVTGDIRDPSGVMKAMDGVDTVFHLAALIGIPYSYHSPYNYVQTNVTGTLNVLEAAKEKNVKRVLITSTSEIYGTAREIPIKEIHPKQPQSPYSATKIGADAIADSYFRSFDLPVTIVRPFNTYGPRQSARAIIPTIITQLLNGSSEIKLGSLTPTRDLVYVSDTADGFIAVADTENLIGHEVNIATGKEISMNDLASTLIRLINPEARIVQDQERMRPEKSEVDRLCGDHQKITDYAGWTPAYDLNKGLKETIDWFSDSENLKGYKSDIYNI
jgi:NAD dependent epimerase/dehydratase